MNRLAALASFVSFLGFASPASADAGSSCHFHGSKPAAQSTVVKCASQRKESLIKAGKLESSWQSITQESVEAVDGKAGKEWKVTFRNPAVADRNKETLYMFFTQTGNFIAANFTGK